ncbi:MAG: DUF2628 domain-containing protein [Culicoidibacterales bacterium]
MQKPQFDEKGRPYAAVEPRAPYGSFQETTQEIPKKPAPAAQNSEETTPSGVTKQEYTNFVQKNQVYYVPKFCLRGGKVSWNWSAFFLGPLWLIYRKMYALAALWVFILLMTSVFGAFVLALMANRLYYLHATRIIAMQKISRRTPEEQRIAIIRAGGTIL